MSAGDYGPRPPYGPGCDMPVTEMTNRQLLHRILAGQRQIQEFIMTATAIVEAATATIASSDAVLVAATRVIAQADTSRVSQADQDALESARAQLAGDTAALQTALANEGDTATATATASTGGPVPTSTATATSTAELRAAEIRDSPLS